MSRDDDPQRGSVDGIPSPRSVRSAAALAALLREIRQAVEDGLLVQIRGDRSLCALAQDIRDIGDDGPWPDSIEARFVSTGAGRTYVLVVETYHGSGGSWGRAER